MVEHGSKQSTTWKTYEQVAQYLLDKMSAEFGLVRVEGKQSLDGQSGTSWELDAKGVAVEKGRIVVIECRRYKSKLKQAAVAAIAFQIADVDAAGGIVVTPIGLQKGAALVAEHAGIELVRLDADATITDFKLELLNRVVIGRSAHLHATVTPTAEAEVVRANDAE